MSVTWNDNVPIYRQLRERVVAMILDGALNEGDALPSVRQVAADYQINPLTVSKAYQELVDEQLVKNGRACARASNAWAWTSRNCWPRQRKNHTRGNRDERSSRSHRGTTRHPAGGRIR